MFPHIQPSSTLAKPINSWYKGATLWETMTSIPEPERKIRAPLRMTIWKFHNTSNGLIAVGRILTGFLRKGDPIVLTPAIKMKDDGEFQSKFQVVSIEKNHQSLLRAIPGDLGMYSHNNQHKNTYYPYYPQWV